MLAARDGFAPVQGCIAFITVRRLGLAQVGALFHRLLGFGGELASGSSFVAFVVFLFGFARLFALGLCSFGSVRPFTATGFPAADVALRCLAFALALHHGCEPRQEVALFAAVRLKVTHVLDRRVRVRSRCGRRSRVGRMADLLALGIVRIWASRRRVARLALLLELAAGLLDLGALVGGGIQRRSGEDDSQRGEGGPHHRSWGSTAVYGAECRGDRRDRRRAGRGAAPGWVSAGVAPVLGGEFYIFQSIDLGSHPPDRLRSDRDRTRLRGVGHGSRNGSLRGTF